MNSDNQNEPLDYSTKCSAFTSSIKAMPLMYASAKADFLILALSSVLSGIAPSIWIYATVQVVDSLATIAQGSGVMPLSPLLVWAIAFLIPRILDPVIQYYQANLAEKFTAFINLRLMEKSSQLKGVKHLDDEEYYNCLKHLQDGARSKPINIVSTVFFVIRDLITIVTICLFLSSITWWLPVVLLLSLYPGILASLHFRALAWKASLGRSTRAREMEYFSHLALDPAFSIESRIYAYYPWLNRRYTAIFEQTHKMMKTIRWKAMLTILPIELFSVASILGMLFWCIVQVQNGELTIGVITSLLQSLALGHATLFGLMESVGIIFERGLFFMLYFKFLAIPDSLVNGSRLTTAPKTISFENVSFAYPNGVKAVKEVTFSLKCGEKIAIVGANGSGKSSLIRLILRLYDPTTGHIAVDGEDLRYLEIESWRSLFGIVPQDIVRYGLTVRENIGISDIGKVDPEDSMSLLALDMAALSGLAANTRSSLDLRLGKEFNGLTLSGGQWQKLSIARAFYREPEILLLDEPSAALDPKSEALFFQSLQGLTKNKTAVFVTHRLSAALLADRILVMSNGMLVEAGTHQQLLQKKGEYALLWQTQTSQYQITPEPVLPS